MPEIVIPHSQEAEGYVLGSILIDEDLANEFCPALGLSDFYSRKNQFVFNALNTLYLNKETINVLNVIETLKSQGKYGEVTESYIFELTEMIPTTVNIEAYIKVLKDKSIERELYYETQNIARKVLAGDNNVSDLLALSERRIKEIADKQSTGNMQTISLSMDKVFNIIDENRHKDGSLIGLDTGYDKLNELTLGFQPGELIILAARPGVGKSAFALNVSRKICMSNNKHVAFFSLEMSSEQILMRLLSMASNVPLSRIRSGNLEENDTTKLLGGRISLDSFNFYLDVTSSNNLEDLKIQCRRLKREGKLDFIVIDYLQLLNVNKDNGKNKPLSRYEEVTILSRSIKLLALELNVPILALSQLSRAPETRAKKEGKGPQLSDLRESGSIEQDADIVMFLYADGESDENSKNREIKLEVAKNRQGQTGVIDLFFRGECTLFENYIGKK